MIILKSLALDVGAGTLDFLLYKDNSSFENSVKMVLPSPCIAYAKRVRNATKLEEDVILYGYSIGGSSLSSAIKEHLAQGNQVFMTSEAAFSLRNNLEEIKSMGVQIIEQVNHRTNGELIYLDELMLNHFESLLKEFGETLRDVDLVAVSVKDHGASPPGMTNREFRMKTFRELLHVDPDLNRFLMKEENVPEYYIRMRSSIKAVKDNLPDSQIVVMDTSPSAILGCLQDSRVKEVSPVLVVNIGNGHTMAAIVSKTRLIGLFEHHTSVLNRTKLESLLNRFANGTLVHSDVFADGGHGVIYFDDAPCLAGLEKIVVTGPKRRLLNGSTIDYLEATPGGDVMMTGTVGILSAVQELNI